MTTAKSEQVAIKHLLVPMVLLAFTMALFFVFQMTQVMRDRTFLTQSTAQLDAPFTESQKLNTQFGGLVVGTQKLAEDGNTSAKDLVKRLKQIGVLPEATPQTESPAPVPAAREKAAPGPVKP